MPDSIEGSIEASGPGSGGSVGSNGGGSESGGGGAPAGTSGFSLSGTNPGLTAATAVAGGVAAIAFAAGNPDLGVTAGVIAAGINIANQMSTAATTGIASTLNANPGIAAAQMAGLSLFDTVSVTLADFAGTGAAGTVTVIPYNGGGVAYDPLNDTAQYSSSGAMIAYTPPQPWWVGGGSGLESGGLG